MYCGMLSSRALSASGSRPSALACKGSPAVLSAQCQALGWDGGKHEYAQAGTAVDEGALGSHYPPVKSAPNCPADLTAW